VPQIELDVAGGTLVPLLDGFAQIAPTERKLQESLNEERAFSIALSRLAFEASAWMMSGRSISSKAAFQVISPHQSIPTSPPLANRCLGKLMARLFELTPGMASANCGDLVDNEAAIAVWKGVIRSAGGRPTSASEPESAGRCAPNARMVYDG